MPVDRVGVGVGQLPEIIDGHQRSGFFAWFEFDVQPGKKEGLVIENDRLQGFAHRIDAHIVGHANDF